MMPKSAFLFSANRPLDRTRIIETLVAGTKIEANVHASSTLERARSPVPEIHVRSCTARAPPTLNA